MRYGILLALLVFCSCSHLAYFPDRALYLEPEKVGLHPKNIFFESGDGTRLHGWLFEAETQPALGTIIQFHGNAQNVSSHYLSLCWIVKRGFNLFIFDYRGYGMSDGSPSQEGLYKDGLAALEQGWAIHRKLKASRFIVYGQSLGGAVALRSFVDFNHQDETALLVMDSTFVSYRDMAQELLKRSWLTWLFHPLGRLLVSDGYAPQDVMPRLHSPLLVIHDKSDPIVGFANGEKLFKLANVPKKDFWILDKGRHVGVFALDTAANRERFLDYLSPGPQR